MLQFVHNEGLDVVEVSHELGQNLLLKLDPFMVLVQLGFQIFSVFLLFLGKCLLNGLEDQIVLLLNQAFKLDILLLTELQLVLLQFQLVAEVSDGLLELESQLPLGFLVDLLDTGLFFLWRAYL